MVAVLSDEEKHILSEMAAIDEKTPVGVDRSFYLIPRSYTDPLPTLAHVAAPWRTEVSEGVMIALAEERLVRRVKPGAEMPWYEVTEAGRQYARRLQSGDAGAVQQKVTERQENRLKFMRQLHDATGGSTDKGTGANVFDIGHALGLSDEETRDVIGYLKNKGLIESPFGASMFKLTQRGLEEVEATILHPDKPTEHLPAANLIYVQTMIGSQVQQGTYGSTMTGTFGAADAASLKQFLDALKNQLANLPLTREDRAEVESDVATIEAQMASSRPKHPIITASMNAIKGILSVPAIRDAASGELIELMHRLPI